MAPARLLSLVLLVSSIWGPLAAGSPKLVTKKAVQLGPNSFTVKEGVITTDGLKLLVIKNKPQAWSLATLDSPVVLAGPPKWTDLEKRGIDGVLYVMPDQNLKCTVGLRGEVPTTNSIFDPRFFIAFFDGWGVLRNSTDTKYSKLNDNPDSMMNPVQICSPVNNPYLADYRRNAVVMLGMGMAGSGSDYRDKLGFNLEDWPEIRYILVAPSKGKCQKTIDSESTDIKGDFEREMGEHLGPKYKQNTDTQYGQRNGVAIKRLSNLPRSWKAGPPPKVGDEVGRITTDGLTLQVFNNQPQEWSIHKLDKPVVLNGTPDWIGFQWGSVNGFLYVMPKENRKCAVGLRGVLPSFMDSSRSNFYLAFIDKWGVIRGSAHGAKYSKIGEDPTAKHSNVYIYGPNGYMHIGNYYFNTKGNKAAQADEFLAERGFDLETWPEIKYILLVPTELPGLRRPGLAYRTVRSDALNLPEWFVQAMGDELGNQYTQLGKLIGKATQRFSNLPGMEEKPLKPTKSVKPETDPETAKTSNSR